MNYIITCDILIVETGALATRDVYETRNEGRDRKPYNEKVAGVSREGDGQETHDLEINGRCFGVELRALDESQINVLITLVNEVFADYPIPVRWTAQDFHLDILENGISLKDSFILWEGPEPVGFIVVGIRDKLARIDAMGVKVSVRGTEASEFLFQNCVENLKWRKISTIQLEVLDSEKRAVRFYEKRGFLVTRKLNAYRVSVNPNLSHRLLYRESTATAISELALEAQTSFSRKLNWQRVPISFHHATGRYRMEAVYSERSSAQPLGFVIWGENEDNFYIVDCYRLSTDIELIDLVHDIFLYIEDKTRKMDGVISNLPEDDKLSEVFSLLGGEQIFSQLEMELKLRV